MLKTCLLKAQLPCRTWTFLLAGMCRGCGRVTLPPPLAHVAPLPGRGGGSRIHSCQEHLGPPPPKRPHLRFALTHARVFIARRCLWALVCVCVCASRVPVILHSVATGPEEYVTQRTECGLPGSSAIRTLSPASCLPESSPPSQKSSVVMFLFTVSMSESLPLTGFLCGTYINRVILGIFIIRATKKVGRTPK